MKFFVFLFVAVALVVFASADDKKVCSPICPALWAPVCAEDTKGVQKNFDNECLFNNANCHDNTPVWKMVGSGPCDKDKKDKV